MKKRVTVLLCGCLCLLLVAGNGLAAKSEEEKKEIKEQLEVADDITKETLCGPGGIQVTTAKDILMSFGALVRVIPTTEGNWDFGMSEKAPNGYLLGSLNSNFFGTHPNEAGWVNEGYIRNESRLYFNALPKDRKWSFYAALEYDALWDTASADSRGGKNTEYSTFGLERLRATMELPFGVRLNAGYDIFNMDAFEGGAMTYGDDNPGIWFAGGSKTLEYNVGYFKLIEANFATGANKIDGASDDDRDLYAAYLIWNAKPTQKFKFFYAYDRIRDVAVSDLLGALVKDTAYEGLVGINGADDSSTDSHHLGAYYVGTFGLLELFVEGVYQFGQAEDTGLSALGKAEDYDISAYALAADLSLEFKGLLTGFPLKPHLGFMYTSGDDNPDDDTLEGYNGVVNAQRFSARWGGENTIIGDTNWVLGSVLYGYLPELYGNGTPVVTGGLTNFTGMGTGRGDNPGLSMVSLGVTVAPKKFLIYKSNINYFRWNEDFEVANYVNPLLGYSTVEAGDVGYEWDNELTLALSRNTFIKAQASIFFPGEALEDATEAMTGEKCDENAYRIAAELIWNF